MSILFSPVGTADPITQLGDGPMLHIARHYSLNKVVLFLSPEMGKFQDEDKRYTFAVEKLCESLRRKCPEFELKHSKTDAVYRFDLYIKEFSKILKRLIKENPGQELLINASSGTPAMEQALVALGAFGEYDLKLLQVTTPAKGTNGKDARENPHEYDLETLWGLNPDNDSNAPIRVEEVELPSFKDMLLRDNIKALIKEYDYPAALELAEQSSRISGEAKRFIKRLIEYLYLSDSQEHERIEIYLSVMEVRLNQENWSDFCRMLTPAFTYTLKRLLSPYLSEEKYLLPEGESYSTELNEKAIDEDDRLRRALGTNLESKRRRITDAMLSKLVREYCEDDKAKEQVARLRTFEREVRNKYAHQIVEVDKEQIEKDGEIALDKVMGFLFELNGVRPGFFDRKNAELLNYF